MFSDEALKKRIVEVLDQSDGIVLLTNLPPHLFGYSLEVLSEHIDDALSVFRIKDLNTLEQNIEYLKSYGDKNEDEDITITRGRDFDFESLSVVGYNRVERVWEPGEYSLFGDVLLIWIEGSSNPIRISMLESEVESLEIVDSITRKKIGERNHVLVKHAILKESDADNDGNLDLDVLSSNEDSDTFCKSIFVYIENLAGTEVIGSNYVNLDLGLRSLPLSNDKSIGKEALITLIDSLIVGQYEGYYVADDLDEYNSLDSELMSRCSIKVIPGQKRAFSKGFLNNNSKTFYITEYEVTGEINLADSYITGDHSSADSMRKDLLLQQSLFKKIKPGDFIVHEDHGIGEYSGVIDRVEGVFMQVDYSGKDRLYVPLTQASKVTKYIGGSSPKLTSLNGGAWRRIKKKAAEDAEFLAKELLQIYAMRKLSAETSKDTKQVERNLYDEFVSKFQFTDTEDQRVATNHLFEDFNRGLPMDRLVVGDVGFGKTEVAMRAIFAIASTGKQVALLAPTTILVEQHLIVLRDRFKDYDFNIAALSRFLSNSEKKDVLSELEVGKIDIIVGTHSLLGESVKFKNLGLIVVDEEQKFGVKQKEKLKQQKMDVHVLSLSATPIPRTLNMSLSGIKDISLIATPPIGRKPIENKFDKFNWDSIKKALGEELERGGQAYFLHNRVRTIYSYKKKLEELFPDRNIEVAHGQMKPEDLGYVMNLFGKGEIDILVCTSIIENGIDLPNVNTLIVNDANMFGLSQLYQIRGRIGRSTKQAYAYFYFKELKGRAGERLDALSDADELGAGFLLANRDLEIRGAGNVLGREQSGAISSVGYGMFMELLDSKLKELRMDF
jgi:transcription-repair coupling factor